jgi:polyhydroxyalkanoate synthase
MHQGSRAAAERIDLQVVDRGRVVRVRKEVRAAPLPRGGAIGLVRKRPAEGRARAPVLLVHGYAQNRYAWHLSRRSFSAYLVEAGYDVFTADLRGAGRSRALGAPAPRHVEELVFEDVPAALDEIARASGERSAFIIGHSLGAAIACAVAGRSPERVRGVVTLAGLYFFAKKSRLLRALGGAATALREALPIHLRDDLPLPTDRVGRFLALSRAAWDSPLSLLAPLSAWAPRSVEPEVLVESIRRSFEPASLGITLCLARMAAGGAFCDTSGRCLLAPFERRSVPLLAACGACDSLIALEDARGAYDRSAARDKTLLYLDGSAEHGRGFGHIDIVMGREAPALVWPAIRAWLDRR